jgi:chromosomal replication initiator protein
MTSSLAYMQSLERQVSALSKKVDDGLSEMRKVEANNDIEELRRDVEAINNRLDNMQSQLLNIRTIETCGESVIVDPQFDCIVSVVSEHYRIPRRDILGSWRDQDIILPRHVAIWAVHESADFPLSKIAKLFKRDHSTVKYAVTKINRLRASDLAVLNDTNAILRKVQA